MNNTPKFNQTARILHWLIAALVLAQLFIGIGQVSTVSEMHTILLSLHIPLGIAILFLMVIRLLVRLFTTPPPLPNDLSRLQKFAATAVHWIFYGLLIGLPLIGWGMLSAEGLPIKLFGNTYLPHILPFDPGLYAILRTSHTYLAIFLFFLVMAHMAAALHHGLIRKDGVLSSMLWNKQRG